MIQEGTNILHEYLIIHKVKPETSKVSLFHKSQ